MANSDAGIPNGIGVLREYDPLAVSRVPVRAEMYQRDGGEWYLLVYAPQDVVSGFAVQTHPPRRIWMHNYGGGLGNYSFLIGSIEPPKKRGWFARHLRRHA